MSKKHDFAQNTWDVIRLIAKTGPKPVAAIAEQLHLTTHTVSRMMRTLMHFQNPIPLYRRTLGDSRVLAYDVDVGRLINQFMREESAPKDKSKQTLYKL